MTVNKFVTYSENAQRKNDPCYIYHMP